MTLTAEPAGQPRLPDQQQDVLPGSPTALVALMAEIVRERFRPFNGLPWAWTEVETPLPTETGQEDGPRKVLIEPAFSVHAEQRNYRPAIYVDKGETTLEKPAVGNLAGRQLRSGLAAFYATATVYIDIECVSDQKGESATLADTVWFYLLAGREQICSTFGLRDLAPPALGRTLPSEEEKVAWSTHVTFAVQLPLRWNTRPIAPLLQSVDLRLRDEGDGYLLRDVIR